MTDAPAVSRLQGRGRAPALFCIAGLDAYQELADALAPDLPVYGVFHPREQQLFQRRRFGHSPERLSVSEMASVYLEMVLEQQPAGPYRLLGFSFAGLLVYEMAQQLHRRGEPVQMIVILDIWLPGATHIPRMRAALSRSKALASRPADEAARFNRFRERLVLDAIDRYQVHRYPGSALVVRAQDTVADLGDYLSDPTYGWGQQVARLHTVDIPGDHVGILRAPNVGVLAEAIRGRLPDQAA